MPASIINSSYKNSLNPLLADKSFDMLPLFGKTISEISEAYLKRHNLKSQNFSSAFENTQDGNCIVLIDECLITETDLTDALELHKQSKAQISAVIRERNKFSPSMPVSLNQKGYITGFAGNEYQSVPSSYECEGIYIISKNALSVFGKLEKNLCGIDIINAAVEKGVKIKGLISPSSSVSIYSIEDYKLCHRKILNKEISMDLKGIEVKDGLWIEEGANISRNVKIETPAYISELCCIEDGSTIGSYSFIGKNTRIKNDVQLSEAIIGSDCILLNNVIVNGGILSDGTSLGTNCKVLDNAVLGTRCRTEKDCFINSRVKIWPNKHITEGTRLYDNLIYGNVGCERIFKNGKISGEINIDITPEFTAKLGSALGTLFKDKKIGVSYDSSPVCLMLANALSAGVISTGASLFVLGEQTLPITRNASAFYGLDASVHINSGNTDGIFSPEICLICKSGMDFDSVSEKKLEAVFFDNVFNRANPDKIKSPVSLAEYRFSYIRDILNELKSESFTINASLRTRSEVISELLEIIFAEMERHALPSVAPEFFCDINGSGENLSLFTPDGNLIDKNRVLYIMAIILIKHFNEKTVVLPISAPASLEKFAEANKVSVILSGIDNKEYMDLLYRYGLTKQLNLCFDGIYFAVNLLDYLNFNGINFSELVSYIPKAATWEDKVECPEIKKSKVLSAISQKYNSSKKEVSDEIKIYKNGGWVLIIPGEQKHSIRIITEGKDSEIAEEICTDFKNRIKKLAKSE